jgi:lysyl-tRNA synthetase class 2
MSLDEIRSERIKKLDILKAAGMAAYPADTHLTHSTKDTIEHFESLYDSQTPVTIGGRIIALRSHGGSHFFDLSDGTTTEHIQCYVKKDEIGEESFELLTATVDRGDFIEITGKPFLTKRGEKSILVSTWRMLSKSIRPLPEKWHGLQDEEEILRHRYLDILLNKETRELFIKRAMFWSSMRRFMEEKGFLEVETPALENTAGGADARPFVTHHNALDIDVFLRISAGELWQKELMVAGYPKTFEIGRIFRNEGIDPEHAQDYTQMEYYWSYADYNDGMKLVQEMYRRIAEETFGTLKFSIRGFEIDLGAEWETYDYANTIKEHTEIDIKKATIDDIEHKLRALGVIYDKKTGWNRTRAVDALWKYCRKKISGPGFLINVPVYMEPLAKRKADSPEFVERFQVILAGSEMGKGFSELNDPFDQAERFEEQAELRNAGDQEAQMYDRDFVEALEYGMPPTTGFGVSERLFSFLAGRPLRECQIFPLLKPRS